MGSQLQAKIMSVVDAEPARTKSAAMCSQMAAANLDRLRLDDEEGGCAPLGPPFTEPTGIGWDVSSEPKNQADMIDLAKRLNPVVGFWDPLDIVNDDTSPETIGWFRHAEIKHGRVAMAAFVGYCVQANGIYFPWKLTGGPNPIMHADISAAGSPADQWDALPFEAKCQIIGAIGTFELIGEYTEILQMNGEKHYVRGGKPGYYPPFEGIFKAGLWPHPLPYSLYDTAGISKKRTPEAKERGLLVEII